MEQPREEEEPTIPKRRWKIDLNVVRDLIGFFICGLFNNFGYVVFLSAAEDIIQGNSGAVLLADILPTLITKLTAPFFMQKISYRVRVVILVAAAVGSFQMVAWGNYVWVKIIGVVLASFSAGFGEITFLALASFYPKNTLSAWSSGTGGAGIAGSVTYLALTVWIALSNRNSLLVVSPLPLLILLSFFVILTGKQNQKDAFMPLSETETKEEETYSNERIEYAEGFSSEAESKDEKEKTEGGLHFQFQLTPLEDKEEGPPSSSKFSLHLKIFHQLVLLRPLLKYMIPLFLVYYFEYVINQGIAPTIVFSGWSSSEAYKYYQLMYQIGVFVSRSSVNLFQIKYLWIPAILQCATMVFLLLQAYFNFIPYIYIIFPIIFWEGLLGGATYVNSMVLIYSNIDASHREFSLGVVSVADDIGISLSAVTSIFLERFLRRHNHID